MSHIKTLQTHYPWISSSTPLTVSAPMRLISTAPLALSVSLAGGLGFLGIGTDLSALPTLLSQSSMALKSSPIPNTPPTILPLGIGFICWGCHLHTALSLVQEATLKPAAIWLFAPKEPSDLIAWSEAMRIASSQQSKIWIQVGTVDSALEVARKCQPDVLVIQGSDAGGHGLANSCSIISLLPECADALQAAGFGHIPLVAAGGISDGRGAAAAVVLGASGVCMGTRFLASPEAEIMDGYRREVVRVRDGGISTRRTGVYDRLRGTTGWPGLYSGRGVLNASFWDWEGGMEEAENRRLYEEALKKGDEGWGEHGRVTAYVGTGVGLVRDVKGAGDIVKEVREDTRRVLDRATGSL